MIPLRMDIAELERPELEAALEARGAERFHAGQIYRWIYRRGITDFQRMTDLSRPLRTLLETDFTLSTPRILTDDLSTDGTRKVLLELSDRQRIEAVFIPDTPAMTFCISTQVGCAMACGFCLTGKMGLSRNLTAGEIAGQVRVLAAATGLAHQPFNIVLMGMGEPLHNYDAVARALRVLCDPDGLALSTRHVTLSTVGLPDAIDRLGREFGGKVALAVSLHAGSDAVRGKLVPVNRAWPIHELLAACGEYTLKTKRDITFEYILADGLNADIEDARQLALVLEGIQCKVNLIPLNPIPEFPYTRPTNARIIAFQKMLAEKKIKSTVRYSSGTDINAACGQLRSVEMSKAQEK